MLHSNCKLKFYKHLHKEVLVLATRFLYKTNNLHFRLKRPFIVYAEIEHINCAVATEELRR